MPGPGIDWAKGANDSAAGRIAVSWSSSAEGFSLEVTIPEGIEAEIVLPDGGRSTITGTGQAVTVA